MAVKFYGNIAVRSRMGKKLFNFAFPLSGHPVISFYETEQTV